MQLWKAKETVVEIGKRLWQRGYVAANDGNISVKIDSDRLLTTPTGESLGFMQPDDLVLCDLKGQVLQGERQPSSELLMHLEVYRLRPEVEAVVHAHPPVATAFSVAGIELSGCVLPESVVVLGAVPIAPYATPWTAEVPEGLRPIIPKCDAVLLQNHGAVTWAEGLEAAYFKMETLEMTATVTHYARGLGQVNTLGVAQVDKLMNLREEKQVPGKLVPCVTDPNCGSEELVERVVQRVLEKIQDKSRS